MKTSKYLFVLSVLSVLCLSARASEQFFVPVEFGFRFDGCYCIFLDIQVNRAADFIHSMTVCNEGETYPECPLPGPVVIESFNGEWLRVSSAIEPGHWYVWSVRDTP